MVRILYRTMKAAEGRPLCGRSARTLGVRIPVDVQPDPEGRVRPGMGMSVAPDTPHNLPSVRRPQAYGGLSRDPLFAIEHGLLVEPLACPIVPPARHALIEPARPLALAVYEDALAATVVHWRIQPCAS